jgi:drug/metabolite transporter (DMT)-like permease
MRGSFIFGAILIAIGAVVLLRGINYNTTHDAVRIGDMHISDTESHGVPQWVGIVAVVGGLAMVGAGATRRK